MFDFDAGKLLIVGVIALICIPPKDLPRAMRTAGQFVGKMRRMAADFQNQFMDAMREADMADVRREAQKLAESARVDVGLNDVAQTMTTMPKLTDEGSKDGDLAVSEHMASQADSQPQSESNTARAHPHLAPAQPASHSV